MAIPINNSEVIGAVLYGLTTNFTGTAFLSFFIIAAGVLLLTALFRIPLELAILLAMPVFLITAVLIGQMKLVLGIALLLVSIIFAKHFFFR